MAGEDTSQPPPPPIASAEVPQMVSSVKLPILKKGEYILWIIKIEQYLTHTEYALWEIILNSNSAVQLTKDEVGNEVEVPPITAQQLLARTRERKAKSTLLIAIPDEHLARFHGIKDAKTLWVAIKTRFGEGLEKCYDRFQRLISLLEIHRACVSTEDANQKFIRSLPSAWSNISLIMRNKPDIENLDIDDLYNNLKVYEADIKGSSRSSFNSHNVAFVSAKSTSSTNELSVTYSVSTTTCHSSQAQEFNGKELVGFDKTKVEWFNCQRRGHFARDCRSYRNSGNMSRDAENVGYKERDNGKMSTKEEDEKALVVQNKLEEEVTETVFDNRLSDEKNSLANDMFKKGDGYHAVPYPLTRNYIPSKSDLLFARLDDSIYKFKISETITSLTTDEKDAPETSTACVKKPKEDKSTGESVKHVKSVKPVKAANQIEKSKNLVDRKDWHGKMTQKLGLGFGFTKKACFVCGSMSHLIKDCTFHKDRMAKKSVLPNNVGKGTGHKEFSAAKPKVAASTSATKPVNTAEPKQNVHFSKSRRSKAVSAVKGNGVTAVKPSAGCVWRPRVNDIDQISKDNRALVTKSHNKTPYELLNGRIPRLDFMRPFGYPITILNTLDPLGKFKGKADEGFLVGYSITSKDFRGIKLTKMHVHNILMVMQSSNDKAADDKPKDNTGSKTIEELVNKEDQAYRDELDRVMSQEKEGSDSSDALRKDTAILRGTGIFISAYDDDLDIFTSPVQSVGADADFNNMESSTIVNLIPIHRVHIDHPKNQILGDPKSAVQTRGMAKKSSRARAFVCYIHKQIRNKKDERGIVVRNKARLVAQGHRKEEGIDYDEVFAPMARIEAIRIFLAFASFMGLIIYQIDVKSTFLYGTIEEDVYVSQPPGFIDLQLPYKVTPKLSHLHAVKQIFRYLKGQPKLGLWYPKDSLFDLEAYSDSDYARSNLDRKSTTGGGSTAETFSTARLDISVVRLEDSTGEPKTAPTTTNLFDDEDVTIADTLVKMKNQKAKEKGIAFRDAARPIKSITTLQPLPTIDPKDKDAKVALKIQANLNEEAMTKRERQEEVSKAALAEMYDEVQAQINANHELAVRLTLEEQKKYTVEERSKLLAEFFESRKKQLAKERTKAIRSKPPTKNSIKEINDELSKTYRKKRAASSSSKHKSTKKQKMNDQDSKDSDKEHRKCLKVVLDNDKAIDYETLDVKSLIIDSESQVLGTNEVVLDRQDVLDLHKIIMERFPANDPEGMKKSGETNKIGKKRYPLTKEILEKMLSLRLEAKTKIVGGYVYSIPSTVLIGGGESPFTITSQRA
nr:hypothetical protein [Tanacetum cinerariifolium]